MITQADMSATAIGLGIVGCGQWGRHILRDLVSMGCDCVVADPSPHARERAVRGGASAAVASIAELPRDLAGYVVVTPASTHHQVIDRLLERKRPIYVEKPLTNSASSALDLAARASGQLFVMEKWRYHGGVQRMAELLRSGTLGNLQSVHCRRMQWGQSQLDVDPIWTLLPHDLSIIDHLLGALPIPVSAYTECDAKTGLPLSLYATLHWFDVTVFLSISSLMPIKERTITLTLDGGTLMMADPMTDHLLWKPANSAAADPAERVAVSTEMPLLCELQAFVAHLRGGPSPMTDCKRATESVVLIEALQNLARRQRGEKPCISSQQSLPS
jgi:predicted dehydrogenase